MSGYHNELKNSNQEEKKHSGFNHSFDVGDAIAFGINEAILLHHFKFFITCNTNSGRNYREGRYWTYDTQEALCKHFPYMSRQNLRTAINSLIKQNVLIKGSFNKHWTDRTTWYAFADPDKFTPFAKPVKNPIEDSNNVCEALINEGTVSSNKSYDRLDLTGGTGEIQPVAQVRSNRSKPTISWICPNNNTEPAPSAPEPTSPTAPCIIISLEESGLSEPHKKVLYKKHSRADLERAVPQAIAYMKTGSVKSLYEAFNVVLKHKDTWEVVVDKASREEENKKYLQEISKLDRKTIAGMSVSVSYNRIEFTYGSMLKIFKASDDDFREHVEVYLNELYDLEALSKSNAKAV